MFVPASDACNEINIDIDTGSTSTTRKWQIKVTQYECGNMMAPDQDCLQWHTAASGANNFILMNYLTPAVTGTIASFNYDTSSSTVSSSQYHLSDQYYDICIRRKRSYCALCFSPKIVAPTSPGTATASSFGLSAGSKDAAQTASVGSHCKGITTQDDTNTDQVGQGDYLEIAALQAPPFSSSTVAGNSRLCGSFFQVNSDQSKVLLKFDKNCRVVQLKEQLMPQPAPTQHLSELVFTLIQMKLLELILLHLTS